MSGAVQAGQRAALEVLAELCPMTLTQEEQEAVWHSQTVEAAAQQTATSKLLYLSASKVVVIATLTISAAVFLSRHQNALLKVKMYLTNVFSTTKCNIFLR